MKKMLQKLILTNDGWNAKMEERKIGYVSPEYALGGVFSIKSEIFSFGVLRLEILSGKKNTEFYWTDSLIFVIYYLPLLCAQESADDRPTVYDVVSMLTNEATTLNPSNRPAFSYVRTFQHRPPARQKIVRSTK
ncbi:hypothetical protein CUMW_263370 [Citrus unshiu]|uniref:Serine-threonine/tyrosine-protein kinase catalytic domain-containing protein n=1 Tax=Citrus unshiu TaxID=55188 RepID=A0A2H5QUP0_CITUN|nr:hypothetical protein CUMW_263370 [Citrus unshiu]